jgi:hypothetical protein
MKNTKLLLILSIFIALLFCLPVTTIDVLATSVKYAKGFEGSVLGQQYHSNSSSFSINTYALLNSPVCENTYYKSGSRGYGATSGTWRSKFILSYSMSNFLTSFSFYTNCVSTGGVLNFYLLNQTEYLAHASNYNKYIARLTLDTSAGKVFYYNDANVSTQLTPSLDGGTNWDSFINFTITDSLGDADYYYSKTGYSVISHSALRNGSAISHNVRIDTIVIDYGSANKYYLDDMNFTISSSYTSGGGGNLSYGCGIDLSPYKKLSMLATGYNNMDSEGFVPATSYKLSQTMYYPHYIETRFMSRLSTRVWGITLLIETDQHLASPSVGDYYLVFNGVNLGYPDCLSQYYDNNTWMLIWDFRSINISLNNEYPQFSFYSNTPWEILYTPFINNGWEWLKAHDSTTLGKNSVYDGTVVYVGTDIVSVPITMYYGTITVNPIASGFKDGIEVNSNTYNQYDTVHIFYKINSTKSAGATNYIRIWKGTSEIIFLNQQLPYQIPASKFSGEKTFIPMIGGSYKICLYRGTSNVSFKMITVTNLSVADSNYVLWSTPNPYDKGQYYTVGYRYYNAEGKEGLINIFPENPNPLNTDYTDFSKATVLTRVLTSNTSGNLTIQYKSAYASNNIIIMYVHTGNLTYNEVKRAFEYYLPDMPLVNSIYVAGSNPHIIPSDKPYVSINIYGTHSYFGFDVYVTLNGKRIYPNSYGLESEFSFCYNISKADTYNVSLKLSTTNGSTYLDSAIFIVQYESEQINPSGDTFGNIVSLIPVAYRFYVGIGVIIAFFLIPLGLIFSALNFASSRGVTIVIPQMITIVLSLGCGITGYILTLLWGLMPAWTVFVLLLILILVTVILWLSNKGKASE